MSSSYLGGSQSDVGNGVAIDPTGAYVVGTTFSTNYPTANPFQANLGGSSDAFVTKVADNGALMLAAPGSQTNLEGDAVGFNLSASNSTGTPVTFSATGLPLGVTIDPNSGRISGALGFGTASLNPYLVSATATAGAATSTQSFYWTVNQLALQTVNPQANLEGDVVSLSLSPVNPAGQPLTFSITGQPAGLTIDPSAGVISGTLATGDASSSPYSVRVTASDGPFSASQTIPWTVSRVLLTAPGDQTNAEGDTVSLQLQATASAGAGAITYGVSNLPAGLTLNTATGLISGSPANLSSNSGPYTVTATATAGGSTSSQSFTWNVTHVLLSSPGDQFNTQGATVSVPLAASDPDSDTLSYSVSGLPAGLGISSTTG